MDIQTVKTPQLLRDAIIGLTATPKVMSPKWFYDAHGSALFEQITQRPEYYPTRTEITILGQNLDRIAASLPSGSCLIELGSGASVKTRILLVRLAPSLRAYVPVDISADFLDQTARQLRLAYPSLSIRPVVADFTHDIALPADMAGSPVVVFFPGSTIGNLEGAAAKALLQRMRALPGATTFILGVDLVKAQQTLVAAYDDAAGLTAAFNLNLLTRLNRETDAAFDLTHFDHSARWNAQQSRIEMHLVSKCAQTVQLHDQQIPFAKGESIHTENSHKFTRDSLTAMVATSGWHVQDWITDADALFAVAVLT